MNEEIIEGIIDSVKHFTKRAESSIEVDKVIDEIRLLKELDSDDVVNIENSAKLYIELAEKKYQAGLLSEQEYIYYQYYAVVALIHETRWLKGHYSNELNSVSKKMRDIEKLHGLAQEEYWAKGNAPLDYQLLAQEYETVLESKLEEEFIEFASKDVSELFIKDKSKLEALSEIGRRSIFIKDEIERLNDLAVIYESESKVNEDGEAFFSASIMLAAAMEARLIVQCILNREDVRNVLLSMGLSNKKLKSKNPLNWKLNILIEVSANAGWLPDLEIDDIVFSSKMVGHTLRSTRNFVHPGMHVKRKAPLALGKEQFKNMKAAYILVSKLLNWSNNQTQPTADAPDD
ncbi:hypothetical protein [Zooshikella harenae]|uniref:Uncharacterized protein n=1 Tax=Zooshikella harenae TaxID=2827238 RepID=A0ABS5ZIB7_9GAMM|nr:hypothetical protein [Zooshikella harenae]MBU2713811.1 hypothetical protein [Zooshikella harenae]